MIRLLMVLGLLPVSGLAGMPYADSAQAARQPGAIAFTADPVSEESPDRPNIVLLISDDQAWTDYGFMQHPVVRTPHLDRLAARSAVFPHGYVPTPLCRPSLLTMATGLYPHQHRVTGNDPAPNPQLSAAEYDSLRERLISQVDRVPTLPKLCSELGYVSHQSGKWWEGNFRRGGFTEGMTRGFPERGGRHGDDGLEIGRKGLNPVFRFIEQSTAQKKPFLVWYAPFLPHSPHNPPERFLKKYTAPDRPIELARYWAMCEWFDETCGQLLQFLDEKQLTSRTLIVYVCDNGWIQTTAENRPTADWKQGFAPRSKQSPYEGGIRTPIMYSWPGRIVPGRRDLPVSSIDIVPTVLSAIQCDAPGGLPGVDLMPELTGQGPVDRKQLYGESYSHDVADLDHPEASLMYRWLIVDGWKLILSYDAPRDRYWDAHAIYDRRPQLFHLSEDPHEEHNLAQKYPEKVEQMSEQLQRVWHVGKAPTK